MAPSGAKLSPPKKALFLTLAENALARKDYVNALVQLLSGQKRRPESIEELLPWTLKIFVDFAPGPGLEKLLLDVIVLCPNPGQVLDELFEELELANKDYTISVIERARRQDSRFSAIRSQYVPFPSMGEKKRWGLRNSSRSFDPSYSGHWSRIGTQRTPSVPPAGPPSSPESFSPGYESTGESPIYRSSDTEAEEGSWHHEQETADEFDAVIDSLETLQLHPDQALELVHVGGSGAEMVAFSDSSSPQQGQYLALQSHPESRLSLSDTSVLPTQLPSFLDTQERKLPPKFPRHPKQNTTHTTEQRWDEALDLEIPNPPLQSFRQNAPQTTPGEFNEGPLHPGNSSQTEKSIAEIFPPHPLPTAPDFEENDSFLPPGNPLPSADIDLDAISPVLFKAKSLHAKAAPSLKPKSEPKSEPPAASPAAPLSLTKPPLEKETPQLSTVELRALRISQEFASVTLDGPTPGTASLPDCSHLPPLSGEYSTIDDSSGTASRISSSKSFPGIPAKFLSFKEFIQAQAMRVEALQALPQLTRRQFHTIIILFALTSATLGYLFIFQDQAKPHQEVSALEAALLSVGARDKEGLKEARDVALEIAKKNPSDTRSFGMAFLFDRSGVAFLGSSPQIDPSKWEAAHRDSFFRAGLIIEALHRDDLSAAQEIFSTLRAEASTQDAGLIDWTEGHLFAHSGAPVKAAKAFARSSGNFKLSSWAILDLSLLALNERNPEVEVILLDALQSQNHPFAAHAVGLLGASPLNIESLSHKKISSRMLSGLGDEQAWLNLSLAYSAHGRGDLKRARAHIIEGLKSASKNPDLWILSGLISLQEGSPERSMGDFQRAFNSSHSRSDFQDSRLLAVALLREAGQPQLAASLLLPNWSRDQSIIASKKKSTPAIDPTLSSFELAELGAAWLAMGELKLLVRFAGAVKALDKESDELTRFAWIANHALGHKKTSAALQKQLHSHTSPAAKLARFEKDLSKMSLKEALVGSQKLLVSNPDHPATMALRADLLSLSGQEKDAIALIFQTSRVEKWPVTLRSQISAALAQSRNHTLKPDQAAAIISAKVQDILLIQMQAEIAWRAGLKDRAQALIQAAIKQSPLHSRSAQGLKALMLPNNKIANQEAVKLLTTALNDPRSLPEMTFELGQRYQQLGAVIEASKIYKSELSNPTQRDEALSRLGNLYLESSHFTKGRRDLESLLNTKDAAASDPQFRAQIHLWMGALYRPIKGNKKALDHLKKAHVVLTEDSRVLFYLGQYYEGVSQKSKAITFYKKALQHDPKHTASQVRLKALGGTLPSKTTSTSLKAAPQSSPARNTSSTSTPATKSNAPKIAQSQPVSFHSKKTADPAPQSISKSTEKSTAKPKAVVLAEHKSPPSGMFAASKSKPKSSRPKGSKLKSARVEKTPDQDIKPLIASVQALPSIRTERLIPMESLGYLANWAKDFVQEP